MFLIFNYEIDLYRFTPLPLSGNFTKAYRGPLRKNGQVINGNPIRLTLLQA